jgi:hypothetical protein
MQASVPDLVDFSDEPQHVIDRYGPDVKTKGTFAYNCLIASPSTNNQTISR